jgi:hypothetical protein
MIILDKSRVPVEKRDDPRLLEIEKAHDLAMQDPAFRLHVCLHEIGHAVYMERLGAKKLTFHPALVWYHAETDTFDVGNMAVQGNFGEEGITADLLAIARWYVAGGVVQHALAVSPLNIDSDGQDFETFTAFSQKLGATPEDIQEHWDKATEDVLRDLRSPVFRTELWSRAKALEKAMFGDTGAFEGVYEYVIPLAHVRYSSSMLS